MSEAVTLRPGLATLADWRAIYRGSPVALDPISRADVEAGVAALKIIQAREQPEQSPEPEDEAPTVQELLHRNGAYLPPALVRLIVALKLASLAQGASGVRWKVIHGLEQCLGNGVIPAIPAGNDSDRFALSHVFGVLTGMAEVASGSARQPAGKELRRIGLGPFKLNAVERQAILSGTQVPTAFALAGLFEAERVFQSALVAAAVSAATSGRRRAPLHPRVQRLHRHPGEIEVAGVLARLAAAPEGAAAGAGGDAAAMVDFRRAEARMGACLDLIRQAGETLEREANAVTERRLVLWQTEEVMDGVEDVSAVVLAADLIAMALRDMGVLAQERMAALYGRAASGEAAANEGAAAPLSMAAAFVGENRERARPRAGDTTEDEAAAPQPANGARRLLPMAGTAALVIAIEILAAVPSEPAAAEGEDQGLTEVHALLRNSVRRSSGGAAFPAAELPAAAELVRSGALAAAAGVPLPSVVSPQAGIRGSRLGARLKRQ